MKKFQNFPFFFSQFIVKVRYRVMRGGEKVLKTKKFVKQFALIVLSMIMMLNFNICAIAATIDKKDDSGLQPMYTTIETNSVYISISGIKATCNATLTSQVPTSLNIKMELQKEKSNGYETIETWTKSKNGASMSFTETRNINIFSKYRLKATLTAGSETVVIYDYPS